MNHAVIRERVMQALNDLENSDAHLRRNDVAERALCARIAHYLVDRFPDHDVDIEYNDHRGETKQLDLPSQFAGATGAATPDVIVHLRGTDVANLLVLEVKKSSNRSNRAKDVARIAAFLDQLGYQCGATVEIPVGSSKSRESLRIDWHCSHPESKARR